MIKVELVLALEEAQRSEFKSFNQPIALKDALPHFTLAKEIALHIPTPIYGIFNQKVDMDYQLKDGDRIEVYRPLIIDPKKARKIRAERKKLR